jgi:hypothetical protein
VSEHTGACVLPLPGDDSCELVRQQYGRCPDHDGWCSPGCPVGDDQEE